MSPAPGSASNRQLERPQLGPRLDPGSGNWQEITLARQHQTSDPPSVAPTVSRCKCCAGDCRRCARQHGPAASPSVSRCPTSLIRSRSTQHTDHTPTSPPPTGLARRRQLPVPEYRPHLSKTPGGDTWKLPAKLFSGFASPPAQFLHLGHPNVFAVDLPSPARIGPGSSNKWIRSRQARSILIRWAALRRSGWRLG